MTKAIEAFRESVMADEVFHAAVIAQFGKRNAGDMRYRSNLFNEATLKAAQSFWQASERYQEQLQIARHAA